MTHWEKVNPANSFGRLGNCRLRMFWYEIADKSLGVTGLQRKQFIIRQNSNILPEASQAYLLAKKCKRKM